MKAFICGWIILTFAGTALMTIHSHIPGEKANAPTVWPKQSAVASPLKTGVPALILFAHPHCPCTIASLSELERLMTKLKDRVDVSVVFLMPEGRGPAWLKDEAWEKTGSIPGVLRVVDTAGIESRVFGAKTSGQVLLYDAQGTLMFEGGITPARGHLGDSDGREAILSWLKVGKAFQGTVKTHVFGCNLNGKRL